MIDVYVVSAFCKDNKGGNKAGIILNRNDLMYSQKIEIAKSLGYSETVFISDSDIADFQLQYYTPMEEVPLCGHATIAAFSLLNTLNMLDKSDYTIETKAGILKIKINNDGLILMEQNCPKYFDILRSNIFTNCLEKDYIDNTFPIQIVSTGLKDILLPINSINHLKALNPNFQNMSDISKAHNVIGVHAFTLVDDSNITARCRNFAPLYGINEESATGTSNCALACYLFKYYKKKNQYIFEQGHHLNEVSRIIVNITFHDDIIDSIFVGGYGHLLFKKTL